ncbi:MAG: hypothetical protein J5986_04175 [Roseburia sp.]|nr:hypothetical protein [Roseburia sp.]
MKQKTTVLYDKNENEMTVPVRKALSVNAPSARYTGYKPETVTERAQNFQKED